MRMAQGASSVDGVSSNKWGVRRECVDRRGCRLLPGPQEVRQGKKALSPLHTKSVRATFLSSLRQVADLEGSDLGQPPIHRIVPPTEKGLERLVLVCGEIDLRCSLSYRVSKCATLADC